MNSKTFFVNRKVNIFQLFPTFWCRSTATENGNSMSDIYFPTSINFNYYGQIYFCIWEVFLFALHRYPHTKKFVYTHMWRHCHLCHNGIANDMHSVGCLYLLKILCANAFWSRAFTSHDIVILMQFWRACSFYINAMNSAIF